MFVLIFTLFWTFSETTYVSETDQNLDFKTISLLPVTDNVNSIYANSIENFLRQSLKDNHHWDFSDQTSIGTMLTPSELEENQAETRRLCEDLNSDLLVSSRLVKSESNINLVISLFSCFDGRLFIKEENNNFNKFSNEDALKEAARLFTKALNRIPFHGRVLSRNGIKVTLDLGENDGIRAGEIVNAIQILEAKRHPKFHFLISTKKQVLGSIKIAKTDKTISFGTIETESRKNIIQRGTKLDAQKFIRYETQGAFNLYDTNELGERSDSKAIFGSNPKKWKPMDPPTLGALSLRLGLGSYTYNISTTNALEADSNFYPSIHINGELWLRPEWTLEAGLRQGLVNIDNPLSGSNPDELSITTTKLDLRVLYNFLLFEDFFGPKLQFITGFSNYITKVDSSNPVSLTDTKYSGIHMGIRGTVPFGLKKEFVGGAELLFYLTSNFSENPIDSGTKDDSEISSFRFFLDYYLNQNLQIVSDLQIDSLQTDFSGPGDNGRDATGSDERQYILSGGVKFLW